MKILYAIQGTGNGHLARAGDVIPQLQKRCTVDLLVSGTQADVKLRYPVKYRLHGLSFIFGKKGGVDIMKTLSEANLRLLYREIKSLPVEDYDFVINDFEPVSAWACQQNKVPCIALSHQSALLSSKVPNPRKIDPLGRAIMKYYAPANYAIGFHFARYDKNIFTPVIRREIREMEIEDRGHYTVYLPSYGDKKLIETFSRFRKVRWHIFSKHSARTFEKDNIIIYPVSLDLFSNSMATSAGVLCGAGFETPAEALYLGKKLMVIPMEDQIEQHYNAAALRMLGVPVIKKLKPKYDDRIWSWLEHGESIRINYPDITASAIHRAIEYYISHHETRRGKITGSERINGKKVYGKVKEKA
ncbi:MAG: glycosyltransferase family protein [bacterium]